MTARINVSVSQGAFQKAFLGHTKDIEKAADAAIREVGAEILRRGRSHISSTGFSRRWAQGLKLRFYEHGERNAISDVAFVYHSNPLASVFETGRTIVGRPLLWMPLRSTPRLPGGQRATPRRWVAAYGPLFRIRSRGRRPLLMGKPPGQPNAKPIPLFVGLDQTQIRDTWNLRELFEDVSKNALPAAFERRLARA